MTAYYNEIDPYAAAWLRNLITAGIIAPGVVDERSIVDVRPDELFEYSQWHFYAGIGTWSYALRSSGWPDSRPVCTFSEPCQPYSAAGLRKKAADDRALRWATHHIISQLRPPECFAEQVASKDGLAWGDTVQADMEGAGYTGGFIDLCAAGFGAPNIRQRQFGYFRLADTDEYRLQGRTIEAIQRTRGREERDAPGCSGRPLACPKSTGGPTNGFWSDADWLFCRDGKWRPVEPGTFPLVDGAAFRLGSDGPYSGKSRPKMLKGYGNGINHEVAKGFIECVMAI